MSCRAERGGPILPQACQLCVSRYTVPAGCYIIDTRYWSFFCPSHIFTVLQSEIFFFCCSVLCILACSSGANVGMPKWITQPSFLSLGRSLVSRPASVLLETLGPSPPSSMHRCGHWVLALLRCNGRGGLRRWESTCGRAAAAGIILFALPLLRGLRCLGLNNNGGGQISLITVSVSGDAGETIEMLHDLGGGAAEASLGTRFPRALHALWEGSVAQAEPRQAHSSPALGGPGRPQTVGTGSAFAGSCSRNFFFLFPSLLRLVLFLSPFTWLPTHAFMQQRATINVPGGAAFLSGFRIVPRAVRFVSHYYAVPDLLS